MAGTSYILLPNKEIKKVAKGDIREITTSMGGSYNILAAGSTKKIVEAFQTILFSDDDYWVDQSLFSMPYDIILKR